MSRVISRVRRESGRSWSSVPTRRRFHILRNSTSAHTRSSLGRKNRTSHGVTGDEGTPEIRNLRGDMAIGINGRIEIVVC